MKIDTTKLLALKVASAGAPKVGREPPTINGEPTNVTGEPVGMPKVGEPADGK
jgi:hypothetical protein